MWASDYVGMPYMQGGRDRDGIDCIGLFSLVWLERRGVIIPPINRVFCKGDFDELRANCGADYAPVAGDVIEGDAVVMTTYSQALHVAYVIDATWVLHIERQGVGSVIEKITDGRVKNRILGVYRYAV